MPGKSLSEVVERCSLNNIIFLRRELKVRLEMGHIYIKDIQFASESKIEDGILYVSEEAVKAVALEDE